MYARKLFGKEVSASSAPPVPAKRDRHADAVVSRRLFEDKLQAQLTEADQAELIAEEEQKAQDVFTTRDAVLKVKFNNLDDSRMSVATLSPERCTARRAVLPVHCFGSSAPPSATSAPPLATVAPPGAGLRPAPRRRTSGQLLIGVPGRLRCRRLDPCCVLPDLRVKVSTVVIQQSLGPYDVANR